jgi:hypothetical protein
MRLSALILSKVCYGFSLPDDSFIDVWFSEKRKGVYAYHWERRIVDGTIYRHDNLPDREARKLETFPRHFHEGSEENIRESRINENPEQAIRQFLTFVHEFSEHEHISRP